MKILVHCCHFASCSGRNITEALIRLKHDVRHTGPAMGRELWGLRMPPAAVWTPDAEPSDDWTPDLCILADTAYQWHYPDESVPTAVWSVDNHVRDLRQPGIAHYFLAHRNVSMMDWFSHPRAQAFLFDSTTGAASPQLDMTHLPCAYDPAIHTPSAIPFADRKYDVCMLGVLQGYPRRVEILKALLAAGYKVKWGAGLIAEDYAAAYQDSRIALCVSFNGDVAQRVFESAAMGCVVLTDNCADFSLLKPDGFYLPDGEDMLTPENAVAAVKTILDWQPGAEEAIKKSSYWGKPHTWEARAQEVIDWYHGWLADTTPKAQAVVSGQQVHPGDWVASNPDGTVSEINGRVRAKTNFLTHDELVNGTAFDGVTVAGNGEVWEAVDDDGFDDDLDDFPDEYEGDE